MFRRLFWRAIPGESLDQKREEKKEHVQQQLLSLGQNWNELEDVLYWKDPKVSFAVYLLISALFWKFISLKLQRFAAGVLILGCLSLFKGLRIPIKSLLIETLGFPVKEHNKLFFDFKDVVEFSVDVWIRVEECQEYLKKLKKESEVKFGILIAVLVSLTLLFVVYVPIGEILFVTVSVLYLLPIVISLGVVEKILYKIEKLSRPVLNHWHNSETKRHRDQRSSTERAKPVAGKRRRSMDSEDEFSLEASQLTESALAAAVPAEHGSRPHSPMNDSFDEFELRSHLLNSKPDEYCTSDDEVEEFLPSLAGSNPGMPSLSQFDSLMEPLDEFHAGLDFRNMSTATPNSNTRNDYYEDTDDELEDLPFEQVDSGREHGWVSEHALRHRNQVMGGSRNFIATGHSNALESAEHSISYEPGFEHKSNGDQDFEFLHRSELGDIPDDELYGQSGTALQHGRSAPREIIHGVVGYSLAGASAVSSLLGYSSPKSKEA